MKYDVFSRRAHWSELPLRGDFLIYDTQLKYWFAISSFGRVEIQGVGRSKQLAYENLIRECTKAGKEAKSLDLFQAHDKMSEEISCRVKSHWG